MAVLYLLMLVVAEDEDTLKLLVQAYVFTMFFYMMHSLWEYHNGRHEYRMGISRMVGVDSTFNDPNAFGASIVLSLPFVFALLRSDVTPLLRKLYYAYFAFAVVCVVLTGSRSASVALLSMLLLWGVAQKGKRKFIALIAAFVAISVVWSTMPEEKKERIRTLWDEKAGPSNAHESAEGRLVGFEVSWKMFKRVPFTGVGAGGKNFIGYRMINRIDEEGHASPTQAHVLYGEVLAELGAGGALLFGGLVVAIWRCCKRARSRLRDAGQTEGFSYRLGGAIIANLLMLLLLGFSGHNFYRPLWLWLAAWGGCLLNISTYLRLQPGECDEP
jgi:O-antigen ligase